MSASAFNIGGGELVEQWFANIAKKTQKDARLNILLEIGYLLGDCNFAAYYGGTLMIGCDQEAHGTGYYVQALLDTTETVVFTAIIDRGEIEYLDFVPGKWQTLLRNWYDEVRRAELKALPRSVQ